MGKREGKAAFLKSCAKKKAPQERDCFDQKLCSMVCPSPRDHGEQSPVSNSKRAADKYTDLLNSRQETGNVVSHRAGTALPEKDTKAEAQAGLQQPPPTLPLPRVHPEDEQSRCSGWK